LGPVSFEGALLGWLTGLELDEMLERMDMSDPTGPLPANLIVALGDRLTRVEKHHADPAGWRGSPDHA